jgi:tetratricopeptide (TPR) repeat protein
MLISAISGTAGVGKTALAVRWAHQVVDSFPDGQLYVNLRGFGPSGTPATPSEAVRGFLDGFAVWADRIPASLEAQTALFRSLTAGKRIFILLDNARDEQQVRPLLAACPSCLVLVTSRSQLTGVIAAEGAVPIVLDVLTEPEARELLARRMGKERISQERVAAAELIRLCVRLPLALSIVSARAAIQPHQRPAAVARELRQARSRLDALGTGDAVSDVRAVFSWSYGALSESAARTFRLLGTHPGPDVSIRAASSLTAMPEVELARALAELTRVHLVSEHAPGRFTFHDLLRAYAFEQAQACEDEAARAAARRRVLDHYLRTAHGAAMLLSTSKDALPLSKPAAGSVPEELSCYAAAWAWFEAEHRVLKAIIGQAAEAGFENDASQLSWLFSDFLDLRGYWHDWADLQRTALAAAQRATDRVGEARSHRDLGYACVRLGSYAEARYHLGRALALHAGMDDRIGQARAHYALAQAAEEEDCYAEALGHAERALTLYSAAGHRPGQGRALNAAGWYRAHLGDAAGAVAFCQQALAIQRDLGDGPAQADTLDSLGYAYLRLGQRAQAVSRYRSAIELYGQFSIWPSQADSLRNLGDLHHGAGNLEAALCCWRQALAILEDMALPGTDQIRARLGFCASPGTLRGPAS